MNLKTTDPIPPRLARKFLHAFLRPDIAEDVAGDLEEKYHKTLISRSEAYANLTYWYQVFAYMRPFAIRRIKIRHSNPYPMYKNYFLTAVRGMIKNKLHSFINIAGLSVGMAVAIIIGLGKKDELSFEKNFDNYEVAAQVIQNVTNNGEVETWYNTPFPLADELRKNYGMNFNYIVMTSGTSWHSINVGGKNFSRSGVFAEPDFSELFSLKMIRGTRDALKEQANVLISESTAKAYFGEKDPIGESMVIDENMNVRVAGVYEDIPVQSELYDTHFVGTWDMLYNTSQWMKAAEDPWRPNAFQLYVTIADNTTFEKVSANIKDAKLKKISPALAKKKPELFLRPMKDWHLRSEYRNGKLAGGRIQYVWLFGTVGIFVIMMACINFMNLSTARSEKRAKEVGIRKAIGSARSQLISQFFSESILTSFLALLIAIGIVLLTLPLFNQFSEKNMTLPLTSATGWITGIVFCFIIGIVAGSYPALYLSSIKPLGVLKGVFKGGKYAGLPRKVLVVLQFSVSVVLIIGTSIVFQQIQYVKQRPLGYSSDGLVSFVLNTGEIPKHFEAFKDDLIKTGTVTDVAMAEAPMTQTWGSSSVFDWDGKDPELSVDFNTLCVSMEYGKTVQWKIVAGRDFSPEFPSDSMAFIINEAAARYLQIKQPLGATIRWHQQPYQVVGIAEDIISRSPYDPVRPMFYYLTSRNYNFGIVRIDPRASTTEAMKRIEEEYKKFNPDLPFEYEFNDVEYARKFGNEERIGNLAGIFTMLAIFISCLGIFGLSSFVAEQRTKEIGVRKVMGASVYELWRMISKDFIVLVILACVIAIPISWQILSAWLDRYQYHMEIQLWLFVVACAATLLITMITISWHTVHAAKVNPVKSLRAE